MSKTTSEFVSGFILEFICGRHAVSHLIAAGRRRVLRLHVQRGLDSEYASLMAQARDRKVPVQIQEASFFQKKWGPLVTHQGLTVEAESYPYVSSDDLQKGSFLLLLDEIQDPQNLGALCRSAQIFGVDGVVIPETHAAQVTAGTCQSSAGAVEYLKIARVSSMAQTIATLKENGFWIYGADAKGAKDLLDEKFPDKVAIVIGNEEKGLRRLVRERCDLLLKIPSSRQEIASLNASAAGAIFLYEVTRQKLKKIKEKH